MWTQLEYYPKPTSNFKWYHDTLTCQQTYNMRQGNWEAQLNVYRKRLFSVIIICTQKDYFQSLWHEKKNQTQFEYSVGKYLQQYEGESTGSPQFEAESSGSPHSRSATSALAPTLTLPLQCRHYSASSHFFFLHVRFSFPNLIISTSMWTNRNAPRHSRPTALARRQRTALLPPAYRLPTRARAGR
jgi:hypothetical protein